MKSLIFEVPLLRYAAAIVFFVFLLSPPHAVEKSVRHNSTGGELRGVPVFFIVALETTIRLALLLVFAVCIQLLMSKNTYEKYHIDYFFIVVGLSGLLHMLAYYIFCGSTEKREKVIYTRLYRFSRNLCFSVLPGFIAVLPVLIIEWNDGIEPYSRPITVQVYLVVTISMVIISMIEAFLTKRVPVGLDKIDNVANKDK